MTREEAVRIFRKEVECLSHAKCEDCILEKVCDPARTTPLDSEYIEAYGIAIQALEQEPCDNCKYLDGDGCRLVFEFEQFGKASDECPNDNNVSISRETYKQVAWERDIAISQLKELGYEFGEKIEPCENTIRRTEVIKAIDEREDVNGKVDAESIRTDIVLMPPVTPQSKTGHWIDDNENEIDAQYGRHLYKCSECNEYADMFVGGTEDWWDLEKPNYCPNCGCRMVEPQESEE